MGSLSLDDLLATALRRVVRCRHRDRCFWAWSGLPMFARAFRLL